MWHDCFKLHRQVESRVSKLICICHSMFQSPTVNLNYQISEAMTIHSGYRQCMGTFRQPSPSCNSLPASSKAYYRKWTENKRFFRWLGNREFDRKAVFSALRSCWKRNGTWMSSIKSTSAEGSILASIIVPSYKCCLPSVPASRRFCFRLFNYIIKVSQQNRSPSRLMYDNGWTWGLSFSLDKSASP